MRTSRSLLGLVAAAAVGIALNGAVTPVQAADDQAYGITQIVVPNVQVNSGSCRDVPLSVTYVTPPQTAFGDSDLAYSWTADIELWRGSTYRESESLSDWPDTTPTTPTVAVNDSFYYCPSVDGLGTFRMGPSHVSANSYSNGADATFADATAMTFSVKQSSRATLSAARVAAKRKYVRYSITASYYSVGASKWTRWKNKPVLLQKLAANGTWVTVARPSTNRLGVVVLMRNAPAAARYQVAVPASSTTWNSVSAQRAVGRG